MTEPFGDSPNLVNEIPEISVHDNRLVSYEVLCRQRAIHLRTEFQDGGGPFEFTEIIFTGVAAYDFWHDSVSGNIIFDIDEVSPSDIYADHGQQFRDGLRYGWPGDWAATAESAAAYFLQHLIRGFELSSSSGMSGWILACNIQKRISGPSHNA